MSDFKPETTTTVTSPQPSFHEYTPSSSSTLQPKRSNIVGSVGLGVNVLSLLSAITILGTAGDVLSVYNATHLGEEFFLPIWPADFDIRPSVALVTCAAIIIFCNIISIVAAKVPAIANKTFLSTALALPAALVSLIASLIATSFFYHTNASSTNYSIQSWTCQWSSIPMDTAPHWNTLCHESKAALYLMIILIPVSAIGLVAAAWGGKGVMNRGRREDIHERKQSPTMN